MVSMARLMSASGDEYPKARRAMSLIFVLMDSIRPFESPCSIAASMDARCLTMDLWSLTDAGSWGPGFGCLVVGQWQDHSTCFLKVVGATENRMCARPTRFGVLVSRTGSQGFVDQRIPAQSFKAFTHP